MRVRRPHPFSITAEAKIFNTPFRFICFALSSLRQNSQSTYTQLQTHLASGLPKDFHRVTLKNPQDYPAADGFGRRPRMGCKDACAETKLTVYSTDRRYSRSGAAPIVPCYREIRRKSSEIGARFQILFCCSRRTTNLCYCSTTLSPLRNPLSSSVLAPLEIPTVTATLRLPSLPF